MKIQFNDHIPIFIQIKEYIQRMVINKELKPGDKTPSVRDLSQSLEVNPNTVQRAFQELEREGFTFTLRGLGTFITKDDSVIDGVRQGMAKDLIKAFFDGMRNLGFSNEDILAQLKNIMVEGGNGDGSNA